MKLTVTTLNSAINSQVWKNRARTLNALQTLYFKSLQNIIFGITLNNRNSIIVIFKITIWSGEVYKGIIKPDPKRLDELYTQHDLMSRQWVVGAFSYNQHLFSNFTDKIQLLHHNKAVSLTETEDLGSQHDVCDHYRTDYVLTVKTDAFRL